MLVPYLCQLQLPEQHNIELTEAQRKLGWPDGGIPIKFPLKITNTEINGNLDFSFAIFQKQITFSSSHFSKDINFHSAIFSENANFERVKFSKYATFMYAAFSKDSCFDRATFNDVDFDKAIFSRNAYFRGATFYDEAGFFGTIFNQQVYFHEATFNQGAYFKDVVLSSIYYPFWGAKFLGENLTFKNATFKYPGVQEDACRKAKILMEKNGNREEAGYHFYKEMDARRKQKPWYIRYPEFVFIQLIFGYGVPPFRLMASWFLIATLFALIYWYVHGIQSKLPTSSISPAFIGYLGQFTDMSYFTKLDWSYFVKCFYFSIVTAVTPGYGKYELTSWEFQVVASIEAIFGTFMWAAFIATFARKYMR